MSPPSTLVALARHRYVSLTTFRRSGEPVSTPVWVAEHDGALVVTTPSGSGKVKRLRRDPRVELRPSDRRGRVPDGAEPVAGVAEVVSDPAAQHGPADVLRRTYGLEYRVVMAVERLVRRGSTERVVLRITPATP